MFGRKNKSKKILDIAYPVLTAYPHMADIQAMLGNNPYTLPLVMSELVELTYDREIERLDFSLGLEIDHYINNYPLVYSHGISRSLVENKWSSVREFIVDVINDGYYVQMLLDTYYVGAYSETYGKKHFNHNIMIYGYDESEEVFYGADCFVGGRYGFEKCSFMELETAFIHTYRDDWMNGIRLFKQKEEPYIGIGYNTDYIIDGCRRYLDGERSNVATYTEGRRRRDMRERFMDGIDIYDELVGYINDWHEDEGWKVYDIRIFYVLYDHARLFRYMTRQLMQRNQMVNAPRVYERFIDVENRIRNLYMLVLKHNITGSERTRCDIKERLLDIKSREVDAIRDFINNADVTRDDIKSERKMLVKPEVISADGIFIEYDYEANWKKKNVNDSFIYTDVKSAHARTVFCGTGVDIAVIKRKNLGHAEIYVDGEMKRVVDYCDGDGEELVTVDGLETGYHWIKIINVSECGEQINVGMMKAINVTESSDETSNSCRLLACKAGTGPNLIGECVGTGYDMVGYKRELPEYITDVNFTYHNAITVLLINDRADRRGVRKSVDREDRIAAYQLSDTEFWVEMTIPGRAREVSFYCVDYDCLGRVMEIQVEDADSEEVWHVQVVEKFSEGVLLKFLLKGHVNVRFKRLEGPDAVLSAVWFG